MSATIIAPHSRGAIRFELPLRDVAPRVVLSPGGAYGPNGEGFFRISLTTPDERLLEAVDRLSRLGG